MKVEVRKVMLPWSPGCSRPRWFVDVICPGDLCRHSDRNFDNEDAARRRAHELRMAYEKAKLP